MPRRVEDIRPNEHRSIRDVSTVRTSRREHVADTITKSRSEVPIHRIKASPKNTNIESPNLNSKSRTLKIKWLSITLGIFIIIASAGYFASTLYSKATFTITPKVVPVVVNGSKTYIAEPSDTAKNKDGVLTYRVMTLRSSATTTVPAIDGAQIKTKATGKIVLYNSNSDKPVKLIAGTRLSGENSQIYHLTSTLSIPAYTKSAGAIIPGKINASIVADQAGQNYNISKTSVGKGDFKIIAYKGSPKYDTIYGRILTDISGGYLGFKKTIEPKTLAEVTNALKDKLSSSLITQAKAAVPDGYILYDNNYLSVIGNPIVGDNKLGTATVIGQGTLYAILLPINSFVDTLVENQTKTLFGNFAYKSPGLEKLEVVINNIKDFNPDKKPSLIIHAKGNIKLIGIIPKEEIKAKLAGISLSLTEGVFRSYNQVIESGTGELVPPWAKVPKDTSRINIVIKDE